MARFIMQKVELIVLVIGICLMPALGNAAVKEIPNCHVDGLIRTFDPRICAAIEQLIQCKIALTVDPSLAQVFTERRFEPFVKQQSNYFLFQGATGLSKTEVAHAIARVTGSELVNECSASLVTKYKGSGVTNVQKIFEQVEDKLKNGKTVVVIFEFIECIGRQRTYRDSREAGDMLCNYLEKYKNDPRVLIICTTHEYQNFRPEFMQYFKDNTITFNQLEPFESTIFLFDYLIRYVLPEFPEDAFGALYQQLLNARKIDLAFRFLQEVRNPLFKQDQANRQEVKKYSPSSPGTINLPKTNCLLKGMDAKFLNEAQIFLDLLIKDGVSVASVESIKNYLKELDIFYKNNIFLFDSRHFWSGSPMTMLTLYIHDKTIWSIEAIARSISSIARYGDGLITVEVINAAFKQMTIMATVSHLNVESQRPQRPAVLTEYKVVDPETGEVETRSDYF